MIDESILANEQILSFNTNTETIVKTFFKKY